VPLTRPEIEKRLVADGLAEKVDLSGMSDETAREIDRTLRTLLAEFKTTRQEVYKDAKQPLIAIGKDEKRPNVYASCTEAVSAINFNGQWFDAGRKEAFEKQFAKDISNKFHPPIRPGVTAAQALTTHEFAHAMAAQLEMMAPRGYWRDYKPRMLEISKIKREYTTTLNKARYNAVYEPTKLMKDGSTPAQWIDKNYISGYAQSKKNPMAEFMAESFAMARLSPVDKVSPFAARVYSVLKQVRGKAGK
jgi:hypothetical protein